MAYLVLENFAKGLDARKYWLAAPAGALVTLENAHITPGGEIEGRKAFTALPVLPAGTFGLEALGNGLVTFGSADLGALFPVANVSYQRLQHPDGATAMSGVVYSHLYGGKAYVIARFADGGTFAYYDGTLVDDFTAGLVLPHLNNNPNGMAAALAGLFNGRTDYQSQNLAANAFKVVGTPEVDFTLDSAVEQVGAGSSAAVTIVPSASAVPHEDGTPAQSRFTIVAGKAGAGNQVTQVNIGATDLMAAPVLYGASEEATAAAVATAISAYAATNAGYTATAAGADVVITAPVAAGDGPNGSVLKVTCAGAVCVGNYSVTLQGTLATCTVDIDGANVYTMAAYPGSLSATASAIATAIQATADYTAVAVGAQVFISKKVTRSDDVEIAVRVNVTGTGSGATTGGSSTSVLKVSLNASAAGTVLRSGGSSYSAAVVCSVSGGAIPYQYFWEYVSGSKLILPKSPNAYWTTFCATTLFTLTAVWRCKVIDSSGNVGVSPQVTITIKP